MTTEGAAGKRFILAGDALWYPEIAKIVAAAGHRVPTRTLPSWLVRVVALFDDTVGLIVHLLDQDVRVSSARARDVLGWTHRPAKETILDTAADIVARRS